MTRVLGLVLIAILLAGTPGAFTGADASAAQAGTTTPATGDFPTLAQVSDSFPDFAGGSSEYFVRGGIYSLPLKGYVSQQYIANTRRYASSAFTSYETASLTPRATVHVTDFPATHRTSATRIMNKHRRYVGKCAGTFHRGTQTQTYDPDQGTPNPG